jgi:hypothetical protein
MEGDAVAGVVDFGGKGLARLPFGRRSAMLVTAVEAAPGLFLDRDVVAVVVDDTAVLLVVLLLPPALLLSTPIVLLSVLLSAVATPLNCSSCFLPFVVPFTEALVSLLLDREGALSLLLLLVVIGAAALSRTLLSIDDILGVFLSIVFWLLLLVYTAVGIVCFFAVVVVVVGGGGCAIAAEVGGRVVAEESNNCEVLVMLSFVIRRVDCLVMDGDLEGRGEPLGDERGEGVEEG